MGQQIIQQPDGKYAVFSTTTDTFAAWDATPEEIIEWRAKDAADRSREATRVELARVQDPNNQRPYAQFTLTWDRAIQLHQEHGGEAIL